MNSQIKKLVQYIEVNKLEIACLLLILGIASFLRFYKITELHFFTYDQARDDLIVKRILVDHKFTLLGPQSSMRGVYLPPFYYYTLAPILWLSRLNPVGVDVYTAIVGILTVVLIWYICREFFGKIPGLMIGALYSTSPLIVELSRRAWNPNTQPFFILLIILFSYRFFREKQGKYLIFSSLAFGYAINLHYGALSLMPVWLLSALWGLIKVKNKCPVLISVLVLFFFGLPLLIFDVRHQFMLTRNLYLYFFAGDRISLSPNKFFEPMVASIYQLFVALLSGSFLKNAQVPFEFWGRLGQVVTFAPVSIIAHKPLLVQYHWWGIGLLVAISATVIWLYFRKTKLLILNLLGGIILVSGLISRFYTGKFYFFYYIFLYPLPFLFLGFVFWTLWQKKLLRWLAVIIFAGMVGFNLKSVPISEKPERTIEDIERVAQTIARDVEASKTFNIASNYRNPDRWDHNAVDYRYFVEAYFGKRALDWQPEDYRFAQILYVVAEGGLSDPINARIMEIYEFAPKRIEKTWELPKEVFIYKMTK